MSVLASKLMRNFEAGFGYPPGDDLLVEATAESGREAAQSLSSVGAPGELRDFYSRVQEVSLPDVGNGFFIASAEVLVEGIRRGDRPTEVTGSVNDAIVVFGSDGGGGLFALSSSSGNVYRLSGGAQIGSTYEVDESGIAVLASGFWEFLRYLLRELVQAVPIAWE
ncbi:hypothetical protein ACFV4N_38770 [Actinosynnema sp. NPDC059797]